MGTARSGHGVLGGEDPPAPRQSPSADGGAAAGGGREGTDGAGETGLEGVGGGERPPDVKAECDHGPGCVSWRTKRGFCTPTAHPNGRAFLHLPLFFQMKADDEQKPKLPPRL